MNPPQSQRLRGALAPASQRSHDGFALIVSYAESHMFHAKQVKMFPSNFDVQRYLSISVKDILSTKHGYHSQEISSCNSKYPKKFG